jgi:hypothetical protein
MFLILGSLIPSECLELLGKPVTARRQVPLDCDARRE